MRIFSHTIFLLLGLIAVANAHSIPSLFIKIDQQILRRIDKRITETVFRDREQVEKLLAESITKKGITYDGGPIIDYKTMRVWVMCRRRADLDSIKTLFDQARLSEDPKGESKQDIINQPNKNR